MKIVNDRGLNSVPAGHAVDGCTYRHQSHLYIKVRLKCIGLSDVRGKVALVNLKHGTTRLVDSSEFLLPVSTHVVCEAQEEDKF